MASRILFLVGRCCCCSASLDERGSSGTLLLPRSCCCACFCCSSGGGLRGGGPTAADVSYPRAIGTRGSLALGTFYLGGGRCSGGRRRRIVLKSCHWWYDWWYGDCDCSAMLLRMRLHDCRYRGTLTYFRATEGATTTAALVKSVQLEATS